MIGPLHDDPIAVQNACSQNTLGPEIRPLVYSLVCAMGENLAMTRVASWVAVFLTTLIFLRTVKKPGFWAIPISLYPVIYFPAVYASQISTSLTALWAATTLAVIRYPFQALGTYSLIGLAVIALGLRAEAPFYLLICWVSCRVLLHIEESDRGGLQKEARKVGLVCLGILGIGALFPILGSPPREYLKVIQAWLPADPPRLPLYPLRSHPAVQIWALLLYLRNFFVPWRAGFYAPWLDWWTIHRSAAFQWLLLGGFATGMAAIVHRLKDRRTSKGGRLALAGLAIFCVSTLLLSVYPRSDWYAPARQFLGSLWFAIALAMALSHGRRARAGLAIAAAFGMAAGLSVYLAHYRNDDAFLRTEDTLNGNRTPVVEMLKGKKALRASDFIEARNSFHRAYEMVPRASLMESKAAADFWIQSLYYGYLSSRLAKDTSSAQSALAELLKFDFYLSTLACLEDPAPPIESCLTESRLKRFCGPYRVAEAAGFPTPYPGWMRIDPMRFCGEAETNRQSIWPPF